jgi:hypothetical protein
MTLENVEIHCKNGRYCIHNDALGKSQYFGAIQKYINVKCYKYVSETDTTTTLGESHLYGTPHTLGFGLDKNMRHIYKDCLFMNYETDGYAFYGHDRIFTSENINNECGNITIDNCIMKSEGTNAVYFQVLTASSDYQIRTDLNNCYISGAVLISGTSPNSFDLTFLNCGNVNVNNTIASNPYEIKAYNTILS